MAPAKRTKEDPLALGRIATAEREEHARRIGALHASLREQLGVVDIAEAQLRAAQAVRDRQRADCEDINTYLERQLREKRHLGEEMAAKYAEQQQDALRSRAELRRLIDAEEMAAEQRRAQNQALMAHNQQSLAFVDGYERLNAHNAASSALIATQHAELAAISADLDLKQRWAEALGGAKTRADDHGFDALPTLLVGMMRAFPQHALVQEQALTMLCALLADDEAHNARCIHRIGGVVHVLRALREQGGTSVAVATHACSLVWMLAVSSSEICEEIALPDALPLLVATLGAHMASARLVYNACGAICHLLVTRPLALTVAAQIGAAPSLGRADVHTHPALTRRARPAVGDAHELRRQVDLARAAHGGTPASPSGSPSPASPARHAVGDTGSDAVVSALALLPSSTRSRRRNPRRAAAAWHRELLAAAVAKLTRDACAQLPLAPALERASAPELAARERAAEAALSMLLRAIGAHPSELKALESALCAIWNLVLASRALAHAFVHAGRDAAAPRPLALIAGALRAHATAPGVAMYALAVLLAVVDVPDAADEMTLLDVREVVQRVSRAHTRNARLQEGAVALLEALDRARFAQLAQQGRLPDGWTAAAHTHWLGTCAQLRESFSSLAPDSTSLYRMLETVRDGYRRLGHVFGLYANVGSGWRDAPIGAGQLGVREWHALAKACRLATRSFDRAQIGRIFFEACPQLKESLAEPGLNFREFVHTLVLVGFERLNPFAADWLLGGATDVPLVPIDEAVSHVLHEHIFALSETPDPRVIAYLIRHELVESITSSQRPLLAKVFRKYALRNSPAATHVVLADVLHLVRAAGIVAPGRLTTKEARCAYADSLPDGGIESLHVPDEHDKPSRYPLDAAQFAECLCRCAAGKLAVGPSEATPAAADAAATLVAELLADVSRALVRGAFDVLGAGKDERGTLARGAAAEPTALPGLTTVRLLPVESDEAEAYDEDGGEEDESPLFGLGALHAVLASAESQTPTRTTIDSRM